MTLGDTSNSLLCLCAAVAGRLELRKRQVQEVQGVADVCLSTTDSERRYESSFCLCAAVAGRPISPLTFFNRA